MGGFRSVARIACPMVAALALSASAPASGPVARSPLPLRAWSAVGPATAQAAPAPAGTESSPQPAPPTTTVLDTWEAQGILGRSVRSAANEDMGRIVDVIVDRSGQARAVVIDFGGFLGVGSRKVAVDWGALRVAPVGKDAPITLDFTRDQVKAAPEYKPGKPMIVLDASGGFGPLHSQNPEQ